MLLPSLGSDPGFSPAAVPPHLPLLSVAFSLALCSWTWGGWSNFSSVLWVRGAKRVCKRSAGALAGGRPISATAISWEPRPGCFLTLSTYPEEKRSGLIPSFASSSFRGECGRWGCRCGRSEVGCRWRTPSPWAILWQTCRRGAPLGDLHLWGRQAGSAWYPPQETSHFPS